MPFAQMSKGAMTSVVGLVADLADGDAVLARRLNLEPFDRRNRLLLGVGRDSAEAFGTVLVGTRSLSFRATLKWLADA